MVGLLVWMLGGCLPPENPVEPGDSGSDSAPIPEDTGLPFDQIVGGELPAGPNPCREAIRVPVGRVIDGDTFEIGGGTLDGQDVRIIGVDTPEIGYNGNPDECWAVEARAFARERLLNRDVWLTFDAQCTDNYGRLLAYVYTGTLEQGNFTVAALSTGQGLAMSIPPNDTFEQLFSDAMDVARTSDTGLWSECR